MANTDFELYVKDKSDRVDQQFVTLIFATLALSVQFSQSMGSEFPWILIASWGFLGIAAFCGCWRISRGPVFDRLNHQRNQIRNFIQKRSIELLDPVFVANIAAGRATDPDTLRTLTLDGVREALVREKQSLTKAESLMDGIAKKFPILYKVQYWSYVVGLLLNGLFASLNLLVKAGYTIPTFN